MGEAREDARVPYSVNIDPLAFEADSEGKYLTSLELCQMTRDIFRAAFADFYGCKFEVLQGQPSISLFFRHIDAPEDRAVATEKSGAKLVNNTVIDKTRGRDQMMRDGDRYILSEDGLDVIKTLLLPMYWNRNDKKIDQKRFVSEIADTDQSSSYFGPQNTVQLTKVSGIDPRRVAAMIWGDKDENGIVDYGVTILKDLSVNGMAFPGMFPSNFVLQITRAHTDTLKKTYEKLYMTPGSNIVR